MKTTLLVCLVCLLGVATYGQRGHVLYVDGGILANFSYVKGENEVPL